MKSTAASKERDLVPVATRPKETGSYLELLLTITDPEIRQVVEQYSEGRQRLKILRQHAMVSKNERVFNFLERAEQAYERQH